MLTGALRVFAYAAPGDMRKAFDGMGAIVEKQLGGHLLHGDVLLFVGRCRKRAKVLHFDGTGLVEIKATALSLLLEGCELAGRWKLSPPVVDEKILAVGKSL